MKTVTFITDLHVGAHVAALEGVYERARTHGWHVVEIEYEHSNRPLSDYIRTWKPAGCIFSCSALTKPLSPEVFRKLPTVYIDPDAETLASRKAKKADEEKRRAALEAVRGLPSETRDGHRIHVFANIGNPGDLPQVAASDAEGVGLFRSEFLYLGRTDYPTEEEQFEAYKKTAQTLDGKLAVIRTLDIGADKKVDYFGLAPEANPAMGLRAIRICLTRPGLFKTQLRALCRASGFGKIAVMFPMIISVAEVRRCKEILAEVRHELKEQGMEYDPDMQTGIMVETPAAAVLSDELAREVDFFSIGSNDLTQYTLAIDRQQTTLDAFFDAHHPAVLRLIRQTIENGHKAGIWVGICGELGADLSLTATFLEMGIDELSVSPPSVLPLRAKIRSLDLHGPVTDRLTRR